MNSEIWAFHFFQVDWSRGIQTLKIKDVKKQQLFVDTAREILVETSDQNSVSFSNGK